MACPDSTSTATTKRKGRTALGYRRFRCRACRRRFNERTGTPFNDLQYPTDIVLLAVLWRLRYKLGFRDVAELLLQRGFEVSHETIRAWEVRFAPLLDNALAESVIGLYKAKLVERKGPWRGLDDLEYATLEWVDWFNHRRLFSAIGYVPPAEYEANLYRGTVPAEAGTQ